MADALHAAGNPKVTMVIDPEAKHGLDGKAFARVRKGMLSLGRRCCWASIARMNAKSCRDRRLSYRQARRRRSG